LDFIAAKDDGGGSDNWSLRCTKLQSNCHHQQSNIQLFAGWMPFLSPNGVEALNGIEKSKSRILLVFHQPELQYHKHWNVCGAFTVFCLLPR